MTFGATKSGDCSRLGAERSEAERSGAKRSSGENHGKSIEPDRFLRRTSAPNLVSRRAIASDCPSAKKRQMVRQAEGEIERRQGSQRSSGKIPALADEVGTTTRSRLGARSAGVAGVGSDRAELAMQRKEAR